MTTKVFSFGAVRTKEHFLLTALLASILFSGCAPKQQVRSSEEAIRPAETSKGRQIEPEARSLYSQAEKAFNARNFDQAAKLYQLIKTKFPRGRAQVYAAYRLGIIAYFKEDYVTASREFDYFLAHSPQSDLIFDATYNYSASEFQLGHYEKAEQILSRLKLSEVQSQGPRRAETVYQLTARVAEALGNHVGAVAAYALSMQLPIDEATRSGIGKHIDDHLLKINSRPQLEQLLSEVTEPETKEKISQRLQALNGEETRPVGVPPVAGAVPTEEGQPRADLPSGSSGSRLNVGVILPLTGRFAAYGKKALDGILLAAKVFQGRPEIALKLFIEDSGSNPLLAQNAVDELYSKNDVMAILGPLNWKESVAAAERAQQLGVLNLSFASKEGISEKGVYLFQNALTPKVQLESLVRYCVTERNLKRFAILAPDNAFGRDLTKQFWDTAEHFGGKVVAYEKYPSEEKDFQTYIQRLVGLDNGKFRKLEQTKLADYIQTLKTKGIKEPKTQLPAVVDFDALFIPDSPKTVAQIAPSLVYFDITGIPLLGTTEWNTDQFYRRGGKYVEGSIFPAGLNLSTRNARQREFIRLYLEAYGTPPDLLATQGFEAMELIMAGLKTTGTNDRNTLVNTLASFRDYETPLGNVTFDSTRIARRRLPVLTLENGGNVTEH
jgi:ABC-type branched-subunit amino acid transport system substrate-binding protein